MSSCSKTSGGVQPQQNISETTTSRPPKARKGCTAGSSSTNPEEYRSRLRPRPTKQTTHFKTPVFVKRLPKQSYRHVVLETDLNSRKAEPAISFSDNCSPSTSKGRRYNDISGNSFSSVADLTINRQGTATKEASKSSVRGRAIKREGRCFDICKSLHRGSKPKRKLASQSDLERKKTPEDSKLVKTSHSSEAPTTSKPASDDKSGAKPKLAGLKFSGKKSKPAEARGQFFTKQFSNSTIRKTVRGGSAASIAKTASSKTGSCASSRRGSERGKCSSGASDRPSDPDDVCGGTSNNQSTQISRRSQELGSQPRALGESGEIELSGPSGNSVAGTAGVVASAMNTATSSNDSESEDADITRLQQLLEARGLPPHFFGNLGPRMQQILHRSMGSGVNSKAQQYLQGIQAVGDESRQLQAAIGMCQLLVMGNEDTLAGFQIKSTVPALINLLRMEHNFDLMNHACRALTYMMEALPRSSAVVVDAVPVFLEKLQVIQCMDVAEQSLTALDMLSRRHAPAILAAGGLSSCLLYIDFFSLPAQRSAMSIAANCCLAIGTMSTDSLGQVDEFDRLVKKSLPLLSSRLAHHDKKCVESACLCFVHLIDNYQQERKILSELAGNDLFKNFQQLLVVTPPLLSCGTFVMVIRSMTIMCAMVRTLAYDLINENVAETLRYLLCGTANENDNSSVELTSRSPQALFEITSLVAELLPRLPKSNPLFSINALLWQSESADATRKNFNVDHANWHWKDESGQWRSYIRHDIRAIEAAHMAGEKEINLTTMDRSYTIDFETMQQINDDTGTARAVQRVLPKRHSDSSKKVPKKPDCQLNDGQNDSMDGDVPKLSHFIQTLFTILYEVYSSSAGSPAVRYECLRAIQRMVYYTEPELLSEVLRDLTVSSHISSMLSSPDIKVIVGALQLAEMLMMKLPNIFAEMFHREGVLHQVKKLTDPSHLIGVASKSLKSASGASSSSSPCCEADPSTVKSLPFSWAGASSSLAPNSVNCRVPPPLTKAKAFAAALKTRDGEMPTGTKKKMPHSTRATRSSASSFFSSLNPSKWGRSLSSVLSNDSGSSESARTNVASTYRETKTLSKLKRNSVGPPSLDKFSSYKDCSNFDGVREWIRDHASKFLDKYFAKNADNNNKQTSVLERLTVIGKNLRDPAPMTQRKALGELSAIVCSVGVSSFELQHSGVVTSLLHYLTSLTFQAEKHAKQNLAKSPGTAASLEEDTSSENLRADLYSRIRCFLAVFAGLPSDSSLNLEDAISHITASQVTPMLNLVRKLNQCVSQLEQLPVKTHDLMSGGSQALRVLSTRQLKCQLQRHPDCHNVKQWLGGPVRVDPLVQVQAIERYLLTRGYGVKTSDAILSHIGKDLELATLQDQDDDSEDEIQDDDAEDLSFDDDTSECLSSEAESHRSSMHGAAPSSSSSAFGDPANRPERKLSSGSLHKLEFFIGNNRLPHQITVYQAVRQYSDCCGNLSSDDEADVSFKMSENVGVWNQTHIIQYKLILPDEEISLCNKGGSKPSKKLKRTGKLGRFSAKKSESLWNDGILPEPRKQLDKYLMAKLPPEFTAPDACSEVLCLLRVVHAMNRYWRDLYSENVVYTDRQLIMSSEFINMKINAKCARQLQDSLIIITGQLTTWLQEIAVVCPFLLSFETRQLLFKITAFDRDRAMQHLLDTGAAQELSTALSNASNSGDNRGHVYGRFMPHLEKKKCSVSRNNLLQQAERIIFEYAHSRAILEVDYEGEVGTGLGPTLEFFTLTSKELQMSALNIWREELTAGRHPALQGEGARPENVKEICKVEAVPAGEELFIEAESSTSAEIKKLPNKDLSKGESKEFVTSPMGLFPKPLGHAAKLSQVNRLKTKFRFIGKFLAKALMDGRMVDLPLSVACYKWLLGEEQSFRGLDLEYVDPGIAPTFNKLMRVAHESELMSLADPQNVESVTMDGCPIEDLGFDMQLPGYPNVELMKHGRNISVTAHNLAKYLRLIVHWTLVEGVGRQMEALKEGFTSVLPLSSLNYFFPEELDQLFCGSRYQPWEVQDLREMCNPDHGYTQDSPAVQRLYRILSTYDLSQQRGFLQFVTGCPHLPVGGFRALNPRLTIVRKNCEEGENIDDYLPSVMTCLNYLKLPDYSTEDIMRAKLQLAAEEGLNSFLLS